MSEGYETFLERKFMGGGADLTVVDGTRIEGYASVFGATDQGGDIVEAGAYAASLSRLQAGGRRVKMLWQHDPTQPIGVWDHVAEDDTGLYVRGHLIPEVAQAKEAAALVAAGAMDGLSIGYRTVRAAKDEQGRRILSELDLWEVSLVTFPMLSDARVGTKAEDPAEVLMRELAAALDGARRSLADG